MKATKIPSALVDQAKSLLKKGDIPGYLQALFELHAERQAVNS